MFMRQTELKQVREILGTWEQLERFERMLESSLAVLPAKNFYMEIGGTPNDNPKFVQNTFKTVEMQSEETQPLKRFLRAGLQYALEGCLHAVREERIKVQNQISLHKEEDF